MRQDRQYSEQDTACFKKDRESEGFKEIGDRK